MASKSSDPIAMSFGLFDETTKRFLKQVQNSFKDVKVPEVEQPRKRQPKQTPYSLTPFEGGI